MHTNDSKKRTEDTRQDADNHLGAMDPPDSRDPAETGANGQGARKQTRVGRTSDADLPMKPDASEMRVAEPEHSGGTAGPDGAGHEENDSDEEVLRNPASDDQPNHTLTDRQKSMHKQDRRTTM